MRGPCIYAVEADGSKVTAWCGSLARDGSDKRGSEQKV